MDVIYEPKGRAQEYSELACNLYGGCPHRCAYCYVPDVLRQDKQTFHGSVQPRKDILKRLSKDAKKLYASRETRPVLLCFTCDPYPQIEEFAMITRKAIQILHSCGLNVAILTKGGRLAERDFDLYHAGDMFGVSLTLSDPEDSKQWEPGAALPGERIASLHIAHEMGIRTWVSFEPVIKPEDTMGLICRTAGLVDIYKIGKLNHHPLAQTINWRDFATEVRDHLKAIGANFYIKKDLSRYLAGVA